MGNSVLQLLIGISVIMAGHLVIIIFKHRAITIKNRSIGEDKQSLYEKIIQAHKYAAPLIYIIIIYYTLNDILTLPHQLTKALYLVFVISGSFYGIRLLMHIIRNALKAYFSKRDKEKSEEQINRSIRGLITFINIIIWIIGSIFIIDNIGFRISAIVTGLGIGGVALALASQSILGDLFHYFVIFFDKPFKIGDFITVADKMGSIEKIGIKTTRIRSLSGEEIIMSNTDLMNGRIHNYGNMKKRRVVLNIGVVFRTSPRTIAAVPGEIKRIINGMDGVEFDRAHFSGFGDSGLMFEAVYYIEGPDYNDFMNKQQDIGIAILKRFKKLNIEFAYPARTVFIERR
ncbi:MAG: mechanosensitive ion channel family protein [Spirochaetes bacterium]|nr:mechanosensitive ion channel family protein [Spirochaetota bacterium]